MELYIAGGCGEHGRNCFCLETEDDAWLVDCGVMVGTEGDGRFPHLNAPQIRKLRAVFLTHSHADHTIIRGRSPGCCNKAMKAL